MALTVDARPRGTRRPIFEPSRAVRADAEPGPQLVGDGKSHTLPGTLLLLLLAGLALVDRVVAVLAIPGVPIYPAEIVLGVAVAYLVTRRWSRTGRVRTGSWFAPLLLVVYLLWGFGKFATSLRYPVLDVVRDSALVYYALFAFVVVGLSSYDSRFNPREIVRLYGRFVPWFVLVAPLRLFGATQLYQEGPLVPGTDVYLLSGHRLGNLGAGLGLAVVYLATAGRRDRGATAMIVGGIVLLLVIGTQNRGGMLAGAAAIAVALALWARFVKLRLIWVIGLLLALFIVAWGFDLRIKAQEREISVSQFTTNIQSITGGTTGAEGQLGDTIDFREELWHLVLDKTVATGQLENGWGFGVNLGSDFIPSHDDKNLRNPHNSHLTVLARLGLVGLGIWIALWLSWFYAVIRRARVSLRGRRPWTDDTGRLALLAAAGVAAILANAYVDPTLETPMVAVWLWSLFGFGVLAVAEDRSRRATGTVREVPSTAVCPPGEHRPAGDGQHRVRGGASARPAYHRSNSIDARGAIDVTDRSTTPIAPPPAEASHGGSRQLDGLV